MSIYYINSEPVQVPYVHAVLCGRSHLPQVPTVVQSTIANTNAIEDNYMGRHIVRSERRGLHDNHMLSPAGLSFP